MTRPPAPSNTALARSGDKDSTNTSSTPIAISHRRFYPLPCTPAMNRRVTTVYEVNTFTHGCSSAPRLCLASVSRGRVARFFTVALA